MSEYFKYLKTTVLFCFTASMLNLLALFACQKGYLLFAQQFTAQTIACVIHFFGLPAMRYDTVIYLKNTDWIVNSECTAVSIMIIFFCLVAFYQTSLKAKIIGVCVGLPIIFAANILRFVIMAYIDKHKPVYLVHFHNSLWQIVFIVMAVLMWMIWIASVAKRDTKTAHR